MSDLMDWKKYSIDEWLKQFGIWCSLQGSNLPDGLTVNQIYWLMQSVNPTPRRTKYCHISDDEALKVNTVLCEMMALMPQITELVIAQKVHRMSLREIEKLYHCSHNQAKELIKCGVYYLAGRVNTTP